MSDSNPFTYNHYVILDLPYTGTYYAFPKQEVDQAYYNTLLTYHPDKASTVAGEQGVEAPSSPPPTRTESDASYTIDEINDAYQTLVSENARETYNRTLHMSKAKYSRRDQKDSIFNQGIDIVDMDDLEFHEEDIDEEEESQGYWYRKCPCGLERGQKIGYEELAQNHDRGEAVVNCSACARPMGVWYGEE